MSEKKSETAEVEIEFHFPKEGVTIKAASIAGAIKKLKKNISSPNKK